MLEKLKVLTLCGLIQATFGVVRPGSECGQLQRVWLDRMGVVIKCGCGYPKKWSGHGLTSRYGPVAASQMKCMLDVGGTNTK